MVVAATIPGAAQVREKGEFRTIVAKGGPGDDLRHVC